jgi:Domain of unknown function (DUF4337)
VEAHEIAEKIHEHDLGHAGHPDTFRKLAAIYVGIVAMLLAIAALGGAQATKEMLDSNIRATDIYGFYQAKHMRESMLLIAAEERAFEVAARPEMPAAAKAEALAAIKRYRATAARYQSDPKTGEGRKQLLKKANAFDEKRDHAARQIPSFEYAEALFQIAIVVGSVSIVAASPFLITLSGALAVMATLLTVNGYFLLVPLPLQ